MTILVAYLYISGTACGLLIGVGIVNYLLDQWKADFWRDLQTDPSRRQQLDAGTGRRS
jgi:hypothetical protein